MLFVLHVNMHMFFGKKMMIPAFTVFIYYSKQKLWRLFQKVIFIEKTVPKHYKTFKIFALNNLTKDMELDRGW